MKRGRPKKVKAVEPVVESVPVDSVMSSATSVNPLPEILNAPATEDIKLVLAPKVYPIPETKEDYLALYQCLKDIGANSIGDIEVRASRM